MSGFEHDPGELEAPSVETLERAKDLIHELAMHGEENQDYAWSLLVDVEIPKAEILPERAGKLGFISNKDMERAIIKSGEEIPLSEIKAVEREGKKNRKETRIRYRKDNIEKTIHLGPEPIEESDEVAKKRILVEKADREAGLTILSEKEAKKLIKELEFLAESLRGDSVGSF